MTVIHKHLQDMTYDAKMALIEIAGRLELVAKEMKGSTT
jgi:hypothetical protein